MKNEYFLNLLARRRGVGPKLLKQIEDTLNDEGLIIVPTENTPTGTLLGLMHRAGFVVCKKLTQKDRELLWDKKISEAIKERKAAQ